MNSVLPVLEPSLQEESGARAGVVCIDFGTAASKAALAKRRSAGAAGDVQVLQIGKVCGAPIPLLLPSALFLDGALIHFGPAAARASAGAPERAVLRSFKMLLSARDLRRSLGSYLAGGIDPDRAFTQRDLILLYLSYLLGAVRRALPLAGESPRAFSSLSIRYAHPGWGGASEKETHTLIARLFDEAEAIETAVGDELFSAHALPYALARAQLDAVRDMDLTSRVEGAVLEGAAAATCHLMDASFEPAFALVVDVGAGTTDFAGFALAPDARGARQIREIAEARLTLSVAGDAVDFALMNVILQRAGRRRRPPPASDVWRQLLPDARALKETIFLVGKGAARVSGRAVTVRLADLAGSADFREIRAALGAGYAQSFLKVAERAQAANAKEIGVILTGGGASLPFLRKIAQNPPPGAKMASALQPLAPAWVRKSMLGGASGALFPLMAVAAGGVMACPALTSPAQS